jgi:two-component system sensor histidine kinase KdpD
MAAKANQQNARPDPDALLALSRGHGRGHLKVFLGAAPGVGKTYAMLQGARRLKETGIDVVLGLVETHGRKETLDLVDGLEVLARRVREHRGKPIEEFDIDAALVRRPGLIVVDELAHTNAPDSRHPKRWQDVEELLDAGINVWTALNIQHLESLADIVSRITGVMVRETVPDTVLQKADDVVLIDITPEELIERLNAGKVYLPETAKRATQNFFTTGNLTALRELALRRTADRVDDQMVDYLRQKAIEGPWGTGERLLVCVGSDKGSEMLVRKASRLATALNASWIAVHLERPGSEEVDPLRERRTGEILQLAESLGADVTRPRSTDFASDILRLARRENATQIFIGRSRAGFFRRLFGQSLSDQLVRNASDVGVHVVASTTSAKASATPRQWLKPEGLVFEGGAAFLSVVAAVGVGQGLAHLLSLPNLSMIFLTAVLFCAMQFGTRAAVIAALLSFLAYNFFFIEPLYTLTIAQPHELFALLIFLVVAVLTGSMAGRIRHQATSALKSSETTQGLYEFSTKLATATNADEVFWSTVSHAQKTLGGKSVMLVPQDGLLETQAAWPPDEPLDTAEQSAARWAFEKGENAGWRTGTLPNVQFRFQPLKTAQRTVGVFGFAPSIPGSPLSAEQERNLAAITEQAAIALDRALLVGESVKSAALLENERTRDALLASLSHDLRTPLATITGSASTLRELGAGLTSKQRLELATSIEQEADRLTRFVTNLLDMSRIESGAIKVRRDWVDLTDVIRRAVERSQKVFPGSSTRVNLAQDLPFARGDSHLVEQVIFNLLDNAHKYGGDGEVSVHARRDGEDILISITDEGPGIKSIDLERVFEKFYRGGGTDGRKPGTGLGLSICRGLIEAMGGTIQAQSPAIRKRGTRMIVRLPIGEREAEK